MRNPRIALTAALLLAAPLFTSGCITTPSIKDRVVDLVASSSASDTLHALGATNTLTASPKTIDLGASLDVGQALSDAGLDISNVKSITLSAVSYRVFIPDPTAGRTITNGNVTIAVGAGSSNPLLVNFSGKADAVTGWITPTLGATAVGQLNTLLAGWLAELKGGAPVNKNLTYSVSGTSAPTSTPTNFYYELKLTVSIVGTVKVKILS
jgi:hypothetical protein